MVSRIIPLSPKYPTPIVHMMKSHSWDSVMLHGTVDQSTEKLLKERVHHLTTWRLKSWNPVLEKTEGEARVIQIMRKRRPSIDDLKIQRTMWNTMWACFRSDEKPLLMATKVIETSVHTNRGLRYTNNLNEVGNGFFSDSPHKISAWSTPWFLLCDALNGIHSWTCLDFSSIKL